MLTKGGWCDQVRKRTHHMRKDRKRRLSRKEELGRRGLGVSDTFAPTPRPVPCSGRVTQQRQKESSAVPRSSRIFHSGRNWRSLPQWHSPPHSPQDNAEVSAQSHVVRTELSGPSPKCYVSVVGYIAHVASVGKEGRRPLLGSLDTQSAKTYYLFQIFTE